MLLEELEGKEELEGAEERRKAKIAAEVTADFERRREERKSLEGGWLLNMNFLAGNQYCDVSPLGGLTGEDKQFYWQSRRVFNHIAPLVETRMAKLERLRPKLTVRAFSDEDGDVKAAKLATGIISFVQERIALGETISRGTLWAEVCGSAFYKVIWDEQGGRLVGVGEDGNPIYEGEVCVRAISPFEIFPDDLAAESLEDVQSLIHAEVVSEEYVLEQFGVAVEGEKIENLALYGYSEPSAAKLPAAQGGFSDVERKGVILIERYVKPSLEEKHGRLQIVAGGKLLYEGELPFRNENRGERGFPFVKQDCLRLPGCFFAGSVVDRLVPVQRAYNAVRNRKHEFLNRLSMGILTVEDGSVDTEELSEEGLLPGKVLVYRQGGKAPEMLDFGGIPSEFADEEAWLEREFETIGGVSELAQNSTPARVTSATGLQLLINQDDARMAATVGSLERAMKELGKQILRLYRQFAGTVRLMTLTGENKKTQAYYFSAADIDANDIHFEAADQESPEGKRETLLKLYEAGILSDENGKLTVENKQRILDAFGFGSYENGRDISALHIAKAGEENLALCDGEACVDEYDDDSLHVVEHTRFLLSSQFKKEKGEGVKERFLAHIRAHKTAEKTKKGGEEYGN